MRVEDMNYIRGILFLFLWCPLLVMCGWEELTNTSLDNNEGEEPIVILHDAETKAGHTPFHYCDGIKKTPISRFCVQNHRREEGISQKRYVKLPYKNFNNEKIQVIMQGFYSNKSNEGKLKALVDILQENVLTTCLHALTLKMDSPKGALLDYVEAHNYSMVLGPTGWALYCVQRLDKGAQRNDLEREENVPVRIATIAELLIELHPELYGTVKSGQDNNNVVQDEKSATLPTPAPTSFSID